MTVWASQDSHITHGGHRPTRGGNAVDGPTAAALAEAFRILGTDETANVAVLCGADGTAARP